MFASYLSLISIAFFLCSASNAISSYVSVKRLRVVELRLCRQSRDVFRYFFFLDPDLINAVNDFSI